MTRLARFHPQPEAMLGMSTHPSHSPTPFDDEEISERRFLSRAAEYTDTLTSSRKSPILPVHKDGVIERLSRLRFTWHLTKRGQLAAAAFVIGVAAGMFIVSSFTQPVSLARPIIQTAHRLSMQNSQY